MFKLEKEIRFEASHLLPYHDGKCQRLHGHSWRATLILEGESLIIAGPKTGMLIDFSTIKEATEPLLDLYLDHWHLNQTTGIESPTSEAIAKFIFEFLKHDLPLLAAVRVCETCTSACEYRP
jgi:6-pyruvoyltetrahydropterin/6-carboxytetrahydropterin synthase